MSSTEYNEVLKDIKETLGLVPGFMRGLPPDVLTRYWPIFKKYHAGGDTEIPAKYRELIGLAIASVIRCPYCIFFHTAAAKMLGATDKELSELAFLAGDTPNWSSMIHAQSTDLETFKRETEQIGRYMSEKSKEKIEPKTRSR